MFLTNFSVHFLFTLATALSRNVETMIVCRYVVADISVSRRLGLTPSFSAQILRRVLWLSGTLRVAGHSGRRACLSANPALMFLH